ncbi:non-ribosomal peptide synthetase [Duganella violaceipulchra]|uniref:Amino acid adenylation domain-containing protein n=1 Tax=Duganella violaceipulchra TaxID=2849652 RepID=A0AA41HJY5_9BURK|nr:non-ribosomal peptide synthetase [Duganella violaceicalia]MBV6325521.1 amino acid adenylation domain-containing protein [Duganella violaceicalia]MCP2012690.1 amino acid adenylation domain-containing protein [Duganella violaceicalia]
MTTRPAFPLTLTQADIYFDQARHPELPLYNVGGYIELGEIDPDRLAQAHARLVCGHDAFGIRVCDAGPEVAQSISDERDTGLALHDFSAAPAPEQAARAWLGALFQTPLPLHRAALFRACLLKLAPRRYWYVGLAHHLSMDGWGFANWARQLGACYHEQSVGGGHADAGASAWRAVAEADQRYLAGPRCQADRDYWRASLARLPEPLLAPLAPARQGAPGASRRAIVSLNAQRMAGLRQLAEAAGVGLPQALAGLLSVYLRAVYGREQLLLGMPVHNRAGAAQKQMVGVFTSVSPLLVEMAPELRLGQLLRALAGRQRASLRHQRYPLGRMLRDLGRQGRAEPLYDVGFSYLKLDSAFVVGGQAARLVYLSHDHEATPLMLTAWDYGQQAAQLQFDCNLGYFSAADIALLTARFAHMLDHCAGWAECALDQLDILPPAERSRLLEDFNRNSGAPAPAACLHALFEAQARATPAAPALWAGGATLDYRQLNERANQVAHRLRATGAGPGALVGVCLERHADMVASLLGVLKAGAAYVPLDPRYPPARLQAIVEDSALHIVLSQGSLRHALPAGAEVLYLDQAATLAGQPRSDPDAAAGASPEQLAYVIYTSGSTGKPKGVAIRHRNAAALVQWARECYAADELRSVLASTSLNFDLSVFELFVPLSLGHRCVLVDDALALLEHDHDVSLVNTVPSAMRLLLERDAVPASARVINLAGEPLPRQLLNDLLARDPRRKVFNLYGPSEDTTYSTCALFTAPVDGPPGIGRAIANTRLYVLSPEAALLPLGAVGELYLGGAGVAQGYLHQPELTGQRFVADPWDPAPGARLYRTGDLVRWEHDGTLAFIGRADEQLKVRGFRVEPGEIEALLSADPAVRDAVVVAAGPAEARYLAAYVVARDAGADPAALMARLRAALAAALPPHLVPGVLVPLERLPLSANGKLDKRALPPPQPGDERAHVAPATPAELTLARIWCALLERQRVGVDDDFFALGGHSLLLTRMLHAARAAGLTLSVAQVFQAPTLGALARAAQASPPGAAAGLAATPPAAELALSCAQQRVWLAATLGDGAASDSNIVGRATLARALDAGRLRAALARLAARHEVLRTHLALADGLPRQVVAAPAPVALACHDLAALDPAARAAALETLLAEHAGAAFDLTRLPLFSLVMLRLAPEQTLLQISIHHLIADGWSMVLFFDALLAAHDDGAAGPDDGAPLLQYRDYVAWQRDFLLGDEAGRQRAFWRDYLHGASEQLLLPFQAPTPSRQGAPGQLLRLAVPAATVDALRALARQARGALFNLMHAALALLLGRLSGESDLNIGIPVSGRHLAGSEAMLGMFLNNLPLRSRIDLAQPFDAFLRAQVANAAAALSHQDLPFEHILALSGVGRAADSTPLFQVFLNMLSLPRAGDGRDLFADAFAQMPALNNKFNLSLYVSEGEGGGALGLYCTYNQRLLARADVELLLEQYLALLAQVAADAGRRCGDYALRAGAPACAGLALPRLAAATLPDYRAPLALEWLGPVQCQFDAVAQRWPQRRALECGPRDWTYAELRRMADGYASRLRALGVGPGDVVAVLTERRDALVIATLAILKTGAAFMMLSRTVPEARVLLQLESVPPRCLVAFDAGAVGAALDARLNQIGCARLLVEADRALLASFAAAEPAAPSVASAAGDLAYIAFTSGTEGRPKAIRGRHSSLSAFMPWMNRQFGLTPEDRFGMLSGLVHDPLQRDMFTPLCLGATLAVPREQELAFESLNDWLLARRLTVLHLTPSLGSFLSSACARPLPSLRLGLFVGEIITTAHLEQFRPAAPGMRVVNIYGTTETGRAISYHDVAAYADAADYCTDVLPVGVGIGQVQLLVLNACMTPCGVGEIGQIATRSHHMSLGYHADPRLTAEKFVRNPYGDDPADLLYLSGDTGRYRRDGVVECLGRSDRQVKVRGFRVELPEIQVCLSAHPALRQVAVTSRVNAAREVEIVAYVVPHAAGAPGAGAEALRDYLAERLPDYMLPAELIFLEQLPLNENGKLDQARLPAGAPRLDDGALAAPASPLEQQLLPMWCALLAREQIGVDQDFFRLGGHSLLATQLLARIERQFGVVLRHGDFFKDNSIRAVARRIEQARLAQGVRRSGAARRQISL